MKTLVLIAGLILLAVLIFKSPGAPAAIGKMPQFKLVKVGGGQLQSEEFRGKVVVVDFWASWCVPCKSEIPKFNKLAAAMAGKDFAIIGYAVESGPIDEVQESAKELGIKYQVVMGTDAATEAFGNYRALPTTFLVGKDGKIYKKYEGTFANKETQMAKDIAELLAVPYTATTAQLVR